MNDINNGGEGAPLVPIYHAAIAKKSLKLPVAILNIGGVSNVTIVKNDWSFIGYDIGPGNGPIDSIVQDKLNVDFDKDGKISKKGQFNKKISQSIKLEIENLKFNDHLIEKC